MFSAIIPASGRGERFGSEIPKQFLLLGGRPLFLYPVSIFAENPLCERIILVTREDFFDFVEYWLDEVKLKEKVHLVCGGDNRQESVYKGVLEAVNSCNSDILLIHDAVRPFVTEPLIMAIYEKTLERGIAIPVIPVRDALVRIEEGRYTAPVSREDLFLVQTPQGAKASSLKTALEKALQMGLIFPDEASLLHYFGYEIALVEGSYFNFKITYPEDLVLAEKLISR